MICDEVESMKVDRRSFLSFVVGGAVGTALSPLPWKLTDDLSIWTQNWPWTPVPANGEASYIQSTCALCPAGGCGIIVRKIENRAVKIEGLEGHPVNHGGICPVGLSGLQLLYGPSRVKTPLKRVGNRGAGRWQKISWDMGLAEVQARLSDLRKAGRAHTVACISGSDRGTVPQLLSRLLTVYGSPNFIRTPSLQDAYELTLHRMQGVQGSAGFDIENASFLLSFGSGITEGWGSPVRMFRAVSHMKRIGAKLVQIEPRLSETAAKSDKWIPIRPGTEGALALGFAHFIIKESLYNRDFVENYTFGFEDRKDKGNTRKGFKTIVLEGYGPDTVSRITGVEKDIIAQTARSFARAAKPLAVCGRGQGGVPGSTTELMAVHALNALVGNINRPGGIWALPELNYIEWPEPEMDAAASTGIQKGRLDESESDRFPHTRYLLNRFLQNASSGKPYGIEALMVSEANPLYSQPDTKAVKDALDKIPFIVSFSSYMDETAKYADLILPNHMYLERYEDVPQPPGLQKPVISLMRPVVSPQFDTRHTGDAILMLAKGIGGVVSKAFPWSTYEDCLEETLGSRLEPLLKKGYWMDEKFQPAPWDKAFDTASSRFELAASDRNDGKDGAVMPAFQAIEPEGDKSYPLILIPYDSMRLANGYVADPPFVIKTVEDTVLKGKDSFVQINPKTAKEIGLSQGKTARLETPKGSARVRIHLYDGIMPGLIAMPRGLGHTAYDEYLSGKGVNLNELMGVAPDPASGLDATWGIRAKLSRA
ncbi:MAG: molybdopterin oxidoreductase [Desulfobacteraceae bacterium]|nr:MAG: molybdopterin oxidoreductase [Desulfobacteraceae bacterium]